MRPRYLLQNPASDNYAGLFFHLQIQHNYTVGLNIYNMSVNVTNDVMSEPVNVTRWIDVQEIVLNISFVAKTIGNIHVLKLTFNYKYSEI